MACNAVREPDAPGQGKGTPALARRLAGAGIGGGSTGFKFEAIKRAKAAATAANPGVPLLDLGVGEPDRPADPAVAARLAREAGRAENRRYADNGIAEFSEAAGRWLESVFGVAVADPLGSIVHGLGSKSIFAMLPLCYVDPGDVALVTTPGYPILATHTGFLGGEAFPLPLLREKGFEPDFDTIPAAVLDRAKLLYLNYPNNPTGAMPPRRFFGKAIDFARSRGILIVHDAAYAALRYDGGKPFSILSIPGAEEVALEVHSLSKAFDMTGWRMGFVCGNRAAVAAYAAVKDTVDSGQFRAVQKAAATALSMPEITAAAVERYSRRLDLLVPALRALGFDAERPAGGFYCYVRAPTGLRDGTRFRDAAHCAERFVTDALVSVVPWDDTGPHLRFSATFEADGAEAERAVIGTLYDRLNRLGLDFGEFEGAPAAQA